MKICFLLTLFKFLFILFLHSLKLSDSLRFSYVFRGYRNEPVAWNRLMTFPRCNLQRSSIKKVFLEIWQNSQESTCARASFNKVAGMRPANVIVKETLAQGYSSKFCEIFKNIFFTGQLRTTASVF